MSTAGIFGLIGSHSLKRKKPDEDDDPEDNINCLSEVEADGNRFILGRVPFTDGPDLQPAMQNNGGLTAARLQGNSRGNLLTKSLKDDPHIGPFVPRLLEWQDGRNSRVRTTGSTSRGWPFPEIGPTWVYVGRSSGAGPWSSSSRWLTFRAGCSGWSSLGPRGTPYRKHFLQLEGLGVRDLVIHEKDLYILAGPTMDLDGPVFIYRWRKALDQEFGLFHLAERFEAGSFSTIRRR